MGKPNIKTIGVLTSGGDAPGMNAAIRAVVRTAIHNGIEVMGVQRGYAGLINGELFPMNRSSVSDIIQRGGTILRTARCLEFKQEEVRKEAAQILADNGVEALSDLVFITLNLYSTGLTTSTFNI